MDSDATILHAATDSDAEPAAGEPGVSSIDLIIELYKKDVDRTLLIEQLRKTPAQRAEELQSFHDAAMAARSAATKSRPR